MEKQRATLWMEKTILAGMEREKKEYACRLLRYEEKQEVFYLELLEGSLTEISLDARYGCRIQEGEQILCAKGIVKERYRSEEGAVVKFYIQNGFYKNTINSVDKTEG